VSRFTFVEVGRDEMGIGFQADGRAQRWSCIRSSSARPVLLKSKAAMLQSYRRWSQKVLGNLPVNHDTEVAN